MNKKLVTGLLVIPMLAVGASALAHTPDIINPFADMSDVQIENLTNQEWESLVGQYEEYDEDFDFGFSGSFDTDAIDKVISEKEWNTLSGKQIDTKLVAAGLEALFDEHDPLYAMTMTEIDKLTDKQWEAIDVQYEELYGEEWNNFDDWEDEDFEFKDFDFVSEKPEIIKEIKEVYNAIKSKLDAGTQNKIKTIIDSLSSITDEDKFFDALEKAYELAEDKIEAYYEAEYGDDFDEWYFDDGDYGLGFNIHTNLTAM